MERGLFGTPRIEEIEEIPRIEEIEEIPRVEEDDGLEEYKIMLEKIQNFLN